MDALARIDRETALIEARLADPAEQNAAGLRARLATLAEDRAWHQAHPQPRDPFARLAADDDSPL